MRESGSEPCDEGDVGMSEVKRMGESGTRGEISVVPHLGPRCLW